MPIEKLEALILNETKKIKNSASVTPITSIVEIIKTIDFQYYNLFGIEKIAAAQRLAQYEYGWGLVFSIFYRKYINNANKRKKHRIRKRSIIDWADKVVYYAGDIEICNQVLNYVKAELMSVSFHNEKTFKVNNLFKNDHEKFELFSLQYNHYKKSLKFEKESKLVIGKMPRVRSELKKYVREDKQKGIIYSLPEEIQNFYSEFSFLYINSTVILDDFDENDKFGNLRYKDYIEFAYYIQRIAFIHRDCCVAFVDSVKNPPHMRKLLTQILSEQDIINRYSSYSSKSPDEVRELLECFSIDHNNLETHINYPKAIPAPLIKINGRKLIISYYGCMKNPVYFLNRELKRRYPSDFFEAVNKRELRFRNEIYELFPQKNIFKVFDNVIIKENGKVSTDIDAIVFDKNSKSLGLFQLKWQDSFTTNFKERFSRISNLIAKSTEWIEKVDKWTKNQSHENILRTLKINGETEISAIHLFVVSRNHMHFTNTNLDERATWASWFQIDEAVDTISIETSTDPILDFAKKIQKLSPKNRKISDVKVVYTTDRFIKLAKYEIRIKS